MCCIDGKIMNFTLSPNKELSYYEKLLELLEERDKDTTPEEKRKFLTNKKECKRLV